MSPPRRGGAPRRLRAPAAYSSRAGRREENSRSVSGTSSAGWCIMAKPSPWNLGGLSAAELGRRVWHELSADEVVDRAAALAYYFLFAIFPTLLFLTSLLGLLPLPGLMERLLDYVDRAVPPGAASILGRNLEEIQAAAPRSQV